MNVVDTPAELRHHQYRGTSVTPGNLEHTGTAGTRADAVEAAPNTATDPNPIDKQRGRAANGGHRTVDNSVA